MITFPLPSMSMEEAERLQFRIVEAATRHFDGHEILSNGDLGVLKGLNQPAYTRRVEQVFSEVFGAEDAAFVRGAGTGAIRWGLVSFLKSGSRLLIHDAPVYPTTRVTLETMGIILVTADFNDLDEVKKVVSEDPDLDGALVQLTRQEIDDRYDFAQVIQTIKSVHPSLTILTDDNYAAAKVAKIGVQCGADLSSFSCFKLLGPEGVGILLGKKELVQKVRAYNYSGGSQVQGHEAMEALRGLVYAPVSLAIQAKVNEELVSRLQSGGIPEVKSAVLANAQSKVLLVEFYDNIADRVLEFTVKHGAAAHPVGCESKYEFVPMIYRISGTFRKQDPELEKRMIRINPMRSGADTVIRILRESILEAKVKR